MLQVTPSCAIGACIASNVLASAKFVYITLFTAAGRNNKQSILGGLSLTTSHLKVGVHDDLQKVWLRI